MRNQKRVVIDQVFPQVSGSDFYLKRVVNQTVTVDAHVLVDGHDIISAAVLFQHENDEDWQEVRMQLLYNDEWRATFTVLNQGFYTYKVQGWVDHPLNWQHGIIRKIDDHQHVKSELLEGIEILKDFFNKVTQKEKTYLEKLNQLFSSDEMYDAAIAEARSETLKDIFIKYPKKTAANTSNDYKVYVDRLKAQFSTWYEFFPRSASTKVGQHGTFKDCEALLPRVAEMGFDTLYFPPIHPIGEVNRKGKNNTTVAFEGDVGSCWGIGSRFGGHKDIHPELGSMEDFKSLIHKAKGLGIEIAMDYALQAAPDHPWVKEHPQWFKWRPDGTVQYAENPPKKYQDILPIYFETEDFRNLWDACLDILWYWIDCGIRIFRVDNPHTKPFYFWNWIITEVKKKHPDVIFLAEAFTKPKVMQQLAKQGYTQSYTYFTWRESKNELIAYMEELTKSDQKEFMRPNFWPNTPDINPFHLHHANESKHIQRYVLAATLSSSVGIYGPVYEQMISDPIPGKEEYLNSEKFQICNYDWNKKNNLITIISKINKIRTQNESLQQTNNIKFCNIDNDKLIAFYKWDDSRKNEVLIIVNLDEYAMQQGMVQLPLQELGIAQGHPVKVTDLITDYAYDWYDEWNFIRLYSYMPFHIFKISK